MNTKKSVKKQVAVKSHDTKSVAALSEAMKVAQPMSSVLADFTNFLREQGVIGLSIAVVLGAAVTKLVGALVSDLINPVIGVLVGAAGDLASMSLQIGSVQIMWGHFLATMIDFTIVASVVYTLVKVLKLDRIDKKKS
ncbi:MscL family protein [Candidatus Woesebacteria bacterium]|nr:MscL family protein [Candidatus Woesebacteria bacterium]